MRFGLIVQISWRPSIRRARLVAPTSSWRMTRVGDKKARKEWTAIKAAVPPLKICHDEDGFPFWPDEGVPRPRLTTPTDELLEGRTKSRRKK